MSDQAQGEPFYRVEDIRAAAQDRWADTLVKLGFAAERFDGRHRPCPGCGGRDRFRFDDQNGTGSFICSRGGGGAISGDGIALYMHAKDCDFKQACRDLGEALGVKPEMRGGKGAGTGSAKPGYGAVAAEPRKRDEKAAFRVEALKGKYRAEFDEGWLRRKSPFDPAAVSTLDYLQVMFRPEEKVVIMDRLKSKGDYLFWHGHGTYRLGARPGIKAVKSPLPTGGPVGVYFMAQPVDPAWKPNNGELSRRAGPNVTTWRYLLLEHDPEEGADKAERYRLWLSFLCQLAMPIASIVTSGGKSIHALVKLEDYQAKTHFDAMREAAKHYLVPFGMDPGAVTGVRLTRLPGCLRGQAMQRLLYLNPSPDPTGVAIADGGNTVYG